MIIELGGPRAHCPNCSRVYEQLAAMVRTAVDGTVDLARNVQATCPHWKIALT